MLVILTRFLLILALLVPVSGISDENIPLHQQIDAIIAKTAPTAGELLSTDAEFLRRVYLDFVGDIPTFEETRNFLTNKDAEKRQRLIDKLIKDDRHVEHMADQFNIFLMERQGENQHWRQWLETAIRENRSWDRMVREIIRADRRDEPNRGATFFISKRLEKYGQNPTDYPGLTRDVGRMFLGIDLQCAECHNHLTVDHYKQADFQGMFAVFQNLKLHSGDVPTVEENLMEGPWEYASVFSGKKRTTGPRLPGLEEITVQTFAKEEAYEVAPDKKAKVLGIPKFSPLTLFSQQIAESPTFSPNIANRIWFMMIGEGIVEPLDLHHPDNPPSNPQLMEVLSASFAKSGYNIRYIMREIALTGIYQRSGQFSDSDTEPKRPLAIERRLSAEQLHRTFFTAAGIDRETLGEEKVKAFRKKLIDAFANEPKQPELEFSPSLRGTLLMLNDEEVTTLLTSEHSNLAARLDGIKDNRVVVEQLFLQVFSRKPTKQELEETDTYLIKNPTDRSTAIADLIWAMLTSTEFATNH